MDATDTSYRLQAPKPRPPPPAPLRFNRNSQHRTSVLGSPKDSQTLLYDLPSSPTMSPPTSPRTKNHLNLTSPTSPTFRGRPTPPPSARKRNSVPFEVSVGELETFAEHCRSWYFSQNEESGRAMTQVMSTLPQNQRAPFSRLQAALRAAYHQSVNTRRNAEFRAHLASTQPGGSLMPHSRADPQGSLAQKERHERLDRFVRTWCTMGMPGTTPFFEALWAVLRLQVVPKNLGGAGYSRIEWEIDDAVFKEAAGKDFMLEAIDVLKGVLAFEERPSHSGSARNSRETGMAPSQSTSTTKTLVADQKAKSARRTSQRTPASSDPFLDNPTNSSSSPFESSASTDKVIFGADDLASKIEELVSPYQETQAPDDDEYMRIWTFPANLTNPEILELLKVFPSFVTRRTLPRFSTNARNPDLEEGEDAAEGKRVHFGTGSMWISSKNRGDGWNGGWWTRFCLWWKRLFC